MYIICIVIGYYQEMVIDEVVIVELGQKHLPIKPTSDDTSSSTQRLDSNRPSRRPRGPSSQTYIIIIIIQIYIYIYIYVYTHYY